MILTNVSQIIKDYFTTNDVAALALLAYLATFWVLYRQLKVFSQQLEAQNRDARLDSTIKLFDQIVTRDYVEITGMLIEEFFKNDCWPLTVITDKAREHLNNLLRTFSNIGVLYQQGALNQQWTMDFCARNVCVLWIILEDFIRNEQQRRRDQLWRWPFLYFVLESLRHLLTQKSPGIRIYWEDREQLYDAEYIRNRIANLETFLTGIRRPIERISS